MIPKKETTMRVPAKLMSVMSAVAPVIAFAESTASGGEWREWPPGPWHMMGGMGWGLWWMFPVLMIAMLAVCAFVMMRMFAGHHQRAEGDSARRILDERFARGEISKEELEEKRAVLRL
jgi:putative membrane protein